MKTKADFRARIEILGACDAAKLWVDSLPDSWTAEEVWNAISHKNGHAENWLFWFARRNQSAEVHKLWVAVAEAIVTYRDNPSAEAREAAYSAACGADEATVIDAYAAANDAAIAAYIAAAAVVTDIGSCAVAAKAFCHTFRKEFPFSNLLP